MNMTLGEKIRKARKGKMTQAELAEAIGVHEMTIRRWELGERSPNVGALQKIANVLSIPLIELTDDAPPETPQVSLPINNIEKEDNVDIAYWGGVLDNARRIAKSENTQDKEVALMMLRMAEEAITGAEKTPTATTIDAHNGENSSYSVNVMNNGTMRGGG